MKYTTYVFMLFVALALYSGCVLGTKHPELATPTTAGYSPEKVLESEIPEVPELTVEESTEIQEIIKLEQKQAVEELDIKKKSVEQMRDDVHKILDEIIEEDSSVVISFSMSYELK